MMTIDACGRSCPEPVVLTKKALADNPATLEVLVDNQTAVTNVTRFATVNGYQVSCTAEGDIFRLEMKK